MPLEVEQMALDLKSMPSVSDRLDGNRQLKDSQFNHSKLTRQIEEMCKNLMIDYNQGLIIQMKFEEKIELKA